MIVKLIFIFSIISGFIFVGIGGKHDPQKEKDKFTACIIGLSYSFVLFVVSLTMILSNYSKMFPLLKKLESKDICITEVGGITTQIEITYNGEKHVFVLKDKDSVE